MSETHLIGHRGLGISFTAQFSPAPRVENTLASLTVASNFVPWCEFDIVFTKNNVPVVYHDLEIVEDEDRKTAIDSLTYRELVGIPEKRHLETREVLPLGCLLPLATFLARAPKTLGLLAEIKLGEDCEDAFMKENMKAAINILLKWRNIEKVSICSFSSECCQFAKRRIRSLESKLPVYQILEKRHDFDEISKHMINNPEDPDNPDGLSVESNVLLGIGPNDDFSNVTTQMDYVRQLTTEHHLRLVSWSLGLEPARKVRALYSLGLQSIILDRVDLMSYTKIKLLPKDKMTEATLTELANLYPESIVDVQSSSILIPKRVGLPRVQVAHLPTRFYDQVYHLGSCDNTEPDLLTEGLSADVFRIMAEKPAREQANEISARIKEGFNEGFQDQPVDQIPDTEAVRATKVSQFNFDAGYKMDRFVIDDLCFEILHHYNGLVCRVYEPFDEENLEMVLAQFKTANNE